MERFGEVKNKYRVGRKTDHNVYWQTGEEPSDKDICVGHFHQGHHALFAVAAMNEKLSRKDEDFD